MQSHSNEESGTPAIFTDRKTNNDQEAIALARRTMRRGPSFRSVIALGEGVICAFLHPGKTLSFMHMCRLIVRGEEERACKQAHKFSSARLTAVYSAIAYGLYLQYRTRAPELFLEYQAFRDSGLPHARYYLAEISLERREWARASELFNELQAEICEFGGVVAFRISYCLGVCYLHLAQYQKALPVLLNALARYNEDSAINISHVHRALGIAYEALGDNMRARAEYAVEMALGDREVSGELK